MLECPSELHFHEGFGFTLCKKAGVSQDAVWCNDILQTSVHQPVDNKGDLHLWHMDDEAPTPLSKHRVRMQAHARCIANSAGSFKCEVYTHDVPCALETPPFGTTWFWAFPWPAGFLFAELPKPNNRRTVGPLGSRGNSPVPAKVGSCIRFVGRRWCFVGMVVHCPPSRTCFHTLVHLNMWRTCERMRESFQDMSCPGLFVGVANGFHRQFDSMLETLVASLGLYVVFGGPCSMSCSSVSLTIAHPIHPRH